MLWWGLASVVLIFNALWLSYYRRWLTEKYQVQGGPLSPGVVICSGAGCLTFAAFLGPVVQTGPTLALAMAVVPLGCTSAWIDSRTFRLPLRLTAILAIEVGLLSLFLSTEQWLAAFIGALVWGALLLVGHLWGNQVGKGDILFGAVLGFWLGTSSLTLAVVGLLLANVALVLWIVAVRRRRSAVVGPRVPFGPYLWGAAVALWGLHIVGTGPHLLVVCGKLALC